MLTEQRVETLYAHSYWGEAIQMQQVLIRVYTYQAPEIPYTKTHWIKAIHLAEVHNL